MSRRAGMSLLEVMVASTILALVLLLTMGILIGSSRDVERFSRAADLDGRSRNFADFCKARLLNGRFSGQGSSVGGTTGLGIQSNYTELRFQIPVSRDASGALSYGYTWQVGVDDPAGAGATGILRFEAEIAMKESAAAGAGVQPAASWGTPFPAPPTLVTRVLDSDIDGDGRCSDTFLWGRIRLYVVSPSGSLVASETLSDQVVLRMNTAGSPQFIYAVTDPLLNASEPVFRFVDAGGALVPGASPGLLAAGVVVTVWHGSFDERENLVLRKGSEMIRFRNPQQ